ncbi:hypothetical protein AX777_05780 [Sphingobium yanoikuyae]|uniref:Uncharacterized protein n=1 Tax=Sphingobium yanoikuyae TaxID=13690 RepID=A0A177JPP6_SPHYA|nr:hypothetical protein [Sphingobium yanoikuyae]OAH42746.1 hypothetical protein AX777_05780 [Sphingobium yanoikuyae]
MSTTDANGDVYRIPEGENQKGKPNYFFEADKAIGEAAIMLDKVYSLTTKREEFVTVNIDPALDKVIALLNDAVALVEKARAADKEATGE